LIAITEPVRAHQYALLECIASGGMGSVYLGTIVRPGGFRRTVAIKRPHPHLRNEAQFMQMLLDEARLTSRVRHPNVVDILDVVEWHGEVLLVMEYVHGLSLSALVTATREQGERIPLAVTASLVSGTLHGLHAAHEAVDGTGKPLGLIHRDVSPQNVLVGIDGVPRVVDFGIARASDRLQETRDGVIKGKLRYLSPEQLHGLPLTQRIDIYAAGVVLWELLVNRSLFGGKTEAETLGNLSRRIVPPSAVAEGLPRELDAVVMKALAHGAERRFATALEMAAALEAVAPCAAPRDVAAWVKRIGAKALAAREQVLANAESTALDSVPPPSHSSSGLLAVTLPTARAAPGELDVTTADASQEAVAPTPLAPAADAVGPSEPSGPSAPLAPPAGNRELAATARLASESAGSGIHDAFARDPSLRFARSRLRVPLAVVGIATGAVGLLLLSVRGHGAPDERGSLAAVGTSAIPPAGTPVAQDREVTPAPVAISAPSAAVPSPTSDAEVSAPSRAADAPRQPAKALPARGSECSPPYEIDARGIRRYKLSCL
jgi:serine/threonine-protein kinase